MATSFADNEWNKSSGAYDILAFVLTLIFLIVFIYQFYCQKAQSHIKWTMKLISITYVFFYCLRYAQATLFFILYPDRNFTEQQEIIDSIIGKTGFVVSHISFYIILLLRLYYAFLDTVLQAKTWELLAYTFSVLVILGLDIASLIISNGHYYLFALTFCNLIIGFALIWSFTQRLFKLVVNQRSWFRQHSDSGIS